LKQYETALIFDAQLEETEFENELQKVISLIESNSGKIVKTDRWGVRKLAYPIKKHPQGYYTFVYYEAPPDIPRMIETNLRINENCLRFMTIVPEFPFEFESEKSQSRERRGKPESDYRERGSESPASSWSKKTEDSENRSEAKPESEPEQDQEEREV
jgi:small subunit ribosomal protein S6